MTNTVTTTDESSDTLREELYERAQALREGGVLAELRLLHFAQTRGYELTKAILE